MTKPVSATSSTVWRDRLQTQFEMPVVRSGSALMLSSVITSILGFAFWLIAARIYTPAELGIGAGAIASLNLLGNMGHLGLRTALIRFLPTSANRSGPFIVGIYQLSVAVSLASAVVFLLGQNLWAPDLDALNSSALTSALFVLSAGFWVIFTLQDGALVGLQRSSWVPIENGAFALAKIVLLVLFSTTGSELGIFYSWVLPVVPVVLLVNLAMTRLVRSRTDSPTHPAIGRRDLVLFSGGEWIASTATLAAQTALPLIVLGLKGPDESAFFYLAWTMSYSVQLLGVNVADALTAEGATRTSSLRQNTFRAIRLASIVVGAASLILMIGAPQILLVFGPEYSDNGTTLLRLLALAMIPNVIIEITRGVLRIHRQPGRLVALNVGSALITVGLGAALLGPLGLTGVGVAWLATSVLLAGVCVLTTLRFNQSDVSSSGTKDANV